MHETLLMLPQPRIFVRPARLLGLYPRILPVNFRANINTPADGYPNLKNRIIGTVRRGAAEQLEDAAP